MIDLYDSAHERFRFGNPLISALHDPTGSLHCVSRLAPWDTFHSLEEGAGLPRRRIRRPVRRRAAPRNAIELSGGGGTTTGVY